MMLPEIKETYKSPNWTKRIVKIDTIIIHQTGGKFPGCAFWMCNPKSKASAHYLITLTGELYRLVSEGRVSLHAGVSGKDYDKDGDIEHDETMINGRSIGIELESVNGETTEDQMTVAYALTEELAKKYLIKRENILGHKEIAPKRKVDPSFDMNIFRGGLIL